MKTFGEAREIVRVTLNAAEDEVALWGQQTDKWWRVIVGPPTFITGQDPLAKQYDDALHLVDKETGAYEFRAIPDNFDILDALVDYGDVPDSLKEHDGATFGMLPSRRLPSQLGDPND